MPHECLTCNITYIFCCWLIKINRLIDWVTAWFIHTFIHPFIPTPSHTSIHPSIRTVPVAYYTIRSIGDYLESDEISVIVIVYVKMCFIVLPSVSIVLNSRFSWSTASSPLPEESRFRNAANAWSEVAPNWLMKLSIHSPRDTEPFPVNQQVMWESGYTTAQLRYVQSAVHSKNRYILGLLSSVQTHRAAMNSPERRRFD